MRSAPSPGAADQASDLLLLALADDPVALLWRQHALPDVLCRWHQIEGSVGSWVAIWVAIGATKGGYARTAVANYTTWVFVLERDKIRRLSFELRAAN